jgi:DNA-binding FadR family transcriptional regulator
LWRSVFRGTHATTEILFNAINSIILSGREVANGSVRAAKCRIIAAVRPDFDRVSSEFQPSIAPQGGLEKVIQYDLHGRVAFELGTAILRGDYAPEAILPREADLMAAFGVSRTVLREALRTLTSKGLIESRPKVGTRVRPRQAWNLLDADLLDWYSRVAPQMAFALKLQEMREMIEPYAAGLAAASRTDDAFAALNDAHSAMVAARNIDEWVRADLRFHLNVLVACSNELLIPLGTLIERTLEAQLSLNARRAEVFNASLAEHTAVFEAIRDRNAPRARRAMAALLGVTRGRIEG